jgi:hypothetical protein
MAEWADYSAKMGWAMALDLMRMSQRNVSDV